MKRALVACLAGLALACSGEGNADDDGGAGGSGTDFLPLPPGSRELDGIVNLVDTTAAAELDAFLTNPVGSSSWVGGLNASLNLFLAHYVEDYDFVYFFTDHVLPTTTVGRFEPVTQPSMPGTGIDFDTAREGYATNGRTRGVIGIQYRAGRYGPMGHELLHTWANYLDRSFGFGVGLEQDFGPHWGFAGIHGLLGGFDAATLQCESPAGAIPPACDVGTTGRTRYVVGIFGENANGVALPADPFELYLMGLVPLAEAPAEIPVLIDAAEPVLDGLAKTATIEAAGVNTVPVSDIVARHGLVRELPAEERSFRAVFVVVSAAPAADAVLGEIATWAKWHGNRETNPDALSFEALTGGRATLDTRLRARRTQSDRLASRKRADNVGSRGRTDTTSGSSRRRDD